MLHIDTRINRVLTINAHAPLYRNPVRSPDMPRKSIDPATLARIAIRVARRDGWTGVNPCAIQLFRVYCALDAADYTDDSLVSAARQMAAAPIRVDGITLRCDAASAMLLAYTVH